MPIGENEIADYTRIFPVRQDVVMFSIELLPVLRHLRSGGCSLVYKQRQVIEHHLTLDQVNQRILRRVDEQPSNMTAFPPLVHLYRGELFVRFSISECVGDEHLPVVGERLQQDVEIIDALRHCDAPYRFEQLCGRRKRRYRRVEDDGQEHVGTATVAHEIEASRVVRRRVVSLWAAPGQKKIEKCEGIFCMSGMEQRRLFSRGLPRCESIIRHDDWVPCPGDEVVCENGVVRFIFAEEG